MTGIDSAGRITAVHSAKRRWRRNFTLIAALTTAGLLANATPGAATTPEPSVPVKYVALGSSFAAGGGTSNPADIVDIGCGRLSTNYAHLVAATLDLQLTDVTCGGATTANILTVPQTTPSDGVVHPPQIDSVEADTDLVTLTAGGNDVGYIASVWSFACQQNPAPVDATDLATVLGPQVARGIFCGSVDRAVVNAALENVQERLETTIREIKKRAPHARVLVVDYATLLPNSGRACATNPLSRDQARFVLQVANKLSVATHRAAEQTRVEFVNLSKVSSRHDACSNDPWVSGWQFGALLQGGTFPFHPNAAGMQGAADLILKRLAR